ncbi:phosphohistidine phosphatase SixA [Brunnivagina elsteri]|uniref:Phosphohistidine phosphatase SixA n=1 Tax=Brunnivagina elsteri CCALA 953 TaxID=987040 RepID=A0A2A2TBQ9_9CYAN|nr:phosphohistidine phosphatase SixA [Calothrix elsteri]PAX51143.1 phosphohistidine phosphatase SixA [Calothrix elsteri CCALA 953]
MEIYLIRHGIAEEQREDVKDEERKLTKEGKQKTEKVAQRLAELDLKFDFILTSPLVRAYQTAEILIKTGLGDKLEESTHLAPNGDISAWIADWLEPNTQTSKISPETKLALVGHEPDLGNWAELLVWGEVKGNIVLKKAGTIGIKVPEQATPLGNSQMFLLTPPKYLL